MQLPLSFQIQNHGRQLLRQTLDKYYAVGESSDAVTLAWNFFMAEVKYLLQLLGKPLGCRERVRVFTSRTCIMNQPAGLATYCQSKARYSWSIFRKNRSL